MCENFTASDFVFSDLNITNIISIYWSETRNWGRPDSKPRSANGLILITDGRIDYDFGGRKISGRPGDVLFFPKGIPYSGRKYGDSPNSFYVLDFQTACDDECTRFPLPLVFHATHYEKIKAGFISVLNQWNSKDTASRLKCRAQVYALLALVTEDYVKGHSNRSNLGGFTEIADYIGKRFTDPGLNVKQVCNAFFISETQLRRLFHKTLARSPLEYIQSIRLDLAKSMLTGENRYVPIEEIALACGFSSASYFSRLFKKVIGVPPSQYKHNQGLR